MLDVLSNALTMIRNAERRGHSDVVIWPSSKLVGNTLRVMQRFGYVGEIEYIEDGRGGKFRVRLMGKINDVRAIRPRFYVKAREIPKWESMYLPGRNMGILILSTSKGVLSSVEAKELNIGGVLLARVY